MAAAAVTFVERRGASPSRSFRVAATCVGIIAAELPDADLVYAGSALGMGKLGYLLHHRGHTHTLVFALVGALLVWLVTLALRKELRSAPYRNSLLLLALLGTVSHLALDFTNNYGVHPFWPVVNKWYYGDAVFIVEPWLWIIAIPPLLAFYHARVPRFLLGLLLVIILAAAWTIGMVGVPVAAMLTAATALWIAVLRFTRAERRIALAAVGWLAMELVFGVASTRARDAVVASTGPNFVDASLTPFIGNPFCYRALVMELDGATYRVANAIVAPFSTMQSASECASRSTDALLGGADFGSALSNHQTTDAIRWSNQWSAPVAELKNLVAERCEVAAAMEFIRVPMWGELPNGDVEIGDARFGVGARGFASVTASAKTQTCPRWLPGWTPPRSDLLR